MTEERQKGSRRDTALRSQGWGVGESMKIKITGGIEATRGGWNFRVVSQRGKGTGSLRAAL